MKPLFVYKNVDWKWNPFSPDEEEEELEEEESRKDGETSFITYNDHAVKLIYIFCTLCVYIYIYTFIYIYN